jgi:hypothetical protein
MSTSPQQESSRAHYTVYQSASRISVSSREELVFLALCLSLIVVDVNGYDSSMGFTQWANKPARSDADVRPPEIRCPHCFDSFSSLFDKCAKPGAFP